MTSSATPDNKTSSHLRALALGAIGVVYGDIGTSPLYTLNQTLTHDGMRPTAESVYGVLSLIFWAQILVVSLKYVVFIMRADNKGEGGIMALMALAQRSVRDKPQLRWILAILAIFGASLFYGDGVITPAISVLSAVEGVKVVAPHLAHWVVPITLVILLFLFAIQRSGTERVGRMFGPIMVVWFVTIAFFGLRMIVHNPHVLLAINPWYGMRFFQTHGFQGFLALGGVVLAITGTEALYADMGHFGKKPIRLAWFNFVLPALVLNYFGQGALLLKHPEAIDNPFFRLVPDMLRLPMIGLACVATVIASQAVISGAFSMTREAMSLGYSPRMAVVHTSSHMSGQVFVPWVNYFLLIMVMLAVLGFRSSDNLGAAYGIAVTGTMAITSLLALVVARYQWGWNRFVVIGVGAVFLLIDLSFFSANLIKIEYGGWFPLALGVVVFTTMTTWRRGRELLLREIKQSGLALQPFIENIAEHPPHRVPGTAVFLTGNQHSVPHALLHNLKHNKVLHERNVLLTVETLETPVAEPGERIHLVPLRGEFYGLEVRFGFAEDPNIPQALTQCGQQGLPFDMMDTTFFLSRENIVADRRRPGMVIWRDRLFVFMTRNAMPATAFFQIPGNRLIELGAQVEI
ncbi:MAG TPA: potassium transporter Kup [Rhodanobacter sp.]